MTTKTEESNKALVLEAFDTLFNKRDYEAAARFWSPNYIQHSAPTSCQNTAQSSQAAATWFLLTK